jgi:hypothetical protein
MSKKTQDNLFCVALLLVFVGFVVLTFQLGSPRARIVPLPIAGLSIVLLLMQLYFQNFRPDIKLNVDSVDLFKITEDTVEAEEDAAAFARKSRKNAHSELNAFAMVAGAFLLMFMLGILEGTFLIVLGYFLWFGKEKLPVSLIWSVGTTAAFYVMFFRLISLKPWEGWIRLTFFS